MKCIGEHYLRIIILSEVDTQFFSHIVGMLTLDKHKGGIWFKDNLPPQANRDMADAVAATVYICLEGKCPDNFYSSQFDKLEALAGLEPCPLFKYFRAAVDN